MKVLIVLFHIISISTLISADFVCLDKQLKNEELKFLFEFATESFKVGDLLGKQNTVAGFATLKNICNNFNSKFKLYNDTLAKVNWACSKEIKMIKHKFLLPTVFCQLDGRIQEEYALETPEKRSAACLNLMRAHCFPLVKKTRDYCK